MLTNYEVKNSPTQEEQYPLVDFQPIPILFYFKKILTLFKKNETMFLFNPFHFKA